MPRKIYDYPNEEKLETLILTNSPCTPSDILNLRKIPIRPNTLETIKGRMDRLCKEGKVVKKKISRANVYWHISIENYKQRVLTKEIHKLIQKNKKS